MANWLPAFRRVYIEDPDADALAPNDDIQCVTVNYMGNSTLETGSMGAECKAE